MSGHALAVAMDVREAIGELDPAARLTLDAAEAINAAMDIVHCNLYEEIAEKGDRVPWVGSAIREMRSISRRALLLVRDEHPDLDKGALYRSIVDLIAVLMREAEALRAGFEKGGES